MSETQETTAQPVEETHVADTPTEATQAAQTGEAAEGQEDTQEATDPAPKPKRTDRHIAQLTARLNALEAEAAAERRRAEAAEALLATREDDERPRDDQGRFKAAEPPVDREAIKREIEFDAKRTSLVEAGIKEFTKDGWDEKTGILHSLGATQNAAFLEALVDLPNATRIVAELADEPDTLVSLLRKSPTAMAAQLGRMDAKMEQPAPARVSAAPKPPTKLDSSTVVPEPDIHDPKLSMAEWMRLMDKREAEQRAAKRR